MANPPVMLEAWNVYAGDYCALEIFLKTGDSPTDISGYTNFRSQWRKSWSDVDPVELDVSVDEDTSSIVIAIPGELSAVNGGLIRSGVWDLQAENDGVTRTFVRGKVFWRGDVTR